MSEYQVIVCTTGGHLLQMCNPSVKLKAAETWAMEIAELPGISHTILKQIDETTLLTFSQRKKAEEAP